MKKDINKELLLQWKKLFIYTLFTYLLSIILILLNVITFIFFKKYFILLTNINIVTLAIIIILNNLKTITIKIRNSTEEEINNLSKSELYYRHLILKKIIVCSNLENIFTEYLSVGELLCEKLMKEK